MKSPSLIVKKIFLNNPVLKLKSNFEGQTCSGNQYFVGGKAGSSYRLSNLIHEICHFAEREKKKLMDFPPSSWGFDLGNFWQTGTSRGHEPQTDQAVQREARVWAFQLSAQKELGILGDAYNLASSSPWIPAFCHFRIWSQESEPEAVLRLAKQIEKMSKVWTWDRLLNDFNERVDYIVNRTKNIER